MGTYTVVTMDGVDLESLGYQIRKIPGMRSRPATSTPNQALAYRIGSILTGRRVVQPRELEIQGSVVGTSASDLHSKIESLQYRLSGTTITIIIQDKSTKQLICYVQTVEVAHAEPELLTRVAAVNIKLIALDPLWQETTNTTVNFTTSNVACALGTAPVRPVITITAAGSINNPVITYRNSSAATVRQMSFTIAMVAGNVLTIDCDAQTITKTISGVTTDASDTLTGGDFIILDPKADGNWLTSSWPGLAVSVGSGQAVYKKRFWS